MNSASLQKKFHTGRVSSFFFFLRVITSGRNAPGLCIFRSSFFYFLNIQWVLDTDNQHKISVAWRSYALMAASRPRVRPASEKSWVCCLFFPTTVSASILHFVKINSMRKMTFPLQHLTLATFERIDKSLSPPPFILPPVFPPLLGWEQEFFCV